jgi:hypothetical protein
MMKSFFSVAVLMAVVSLPMLAAAPLAGMTGSTGTWKVIGDVQGVPVILTCSLVQADSKVTGACVDDQSKSHPLTGEVKDQTVSWAFATEYEGSPITVNLSGTIDATGAKMAGTIAVDPMQVDGTFNATLQPTTPAAATPAE